MSELVWTSERPKEGGYYWLLPAVGHQVVLAKVNSYLDCDDRGEVFTKIDEEDAVRIKVYRSRMRMEKGYPDGEYRFWGPTKAIDGMWAGPLPLAPDLIKGAEQFAENIQRLRDSGVNCSTAAVNLSAEDLAELATEPPRELFEEDWRAQQKVVTQ